MMDNNKIRPEWVPSGYKEKPNNNQVVEVSEVERTLYNRKVVVFGFKRKRIK